MAETRFKDLDVDNLFDFCAVLDAVGAEDVIHAFDKNEIAALQDSGQDIKGVGLAITMKIAGVLIHNLPKAKTEICSFFAGCMEWDNGKPVTPEELRKFKIGRFFRLIRDFCRKDDLTDFFGEAVRSLAAGQSDSPSSSTEDTEIPGVISAAQSDGES